jgi:hypothetical protein
MKMFIFVLLRALTFVPCNCSLGANMSLVLTRILWSHHQVLRRAHEDTTALSIHRDVIYSGTFDACAPFGFAHGRTL